MNQDTDTTSQASSAAEVSARRFVVGCDLGTTNCAVAYVDTLEEPWRIRTFAIPQHTAAGLVESRDTLPSFHYQAAEGEFAGETLRLPWDASPPRHTVGFLARDHGTVVPARLVASAKSWLCHTGVDRTADLLPWQAVPDVERISPVEASARYLAHVHRAWNHHFPQHPLAEQDFVVTLPASFDEVARELTVRACARAGLPRVILIEEPQAAFYSWLYRHADRWQTFVAPGQKILICDVGGGTSDFTLIRVRQGESEAVRFHRVAVGEHLILGGDNMDLALAHHLEAKLSPNEKLNPRAWSTLVRACRQTKELLLSETAPEQTTITLPGSGSRVIGGGRQVSVTRAELLALLADGFFPEVALTDKPIARRSGFQEFGLPYAADPAITRYLATFLLTHSHAGDVAEPGPVATGQSPIESEGNTVAARLAARPDIILFNGGVFASPVFRQRVLDSLSRWFGDASQATSTTTATTTTATGAGTDSRWRPLVLDHDRLDLAVAWGAAYYGMVRRGKGVRVSSRLARSYYVGIAGETPGVPDALCVLPAGTEPGQTVELADRPLDLLVSQPVEFPLYYSSVRLTDPAGSLTPVDPERLAALPPIRTVLQARKGGETGTVPVHLHARLTEIGTLDLWCAEIAGKRSWKLQFDVRHATETDVAGHESAAEGQGIVDETLWQAVADELRLRFPIERGSSVEQVPSSHSAPGVSPGRSALAGEAGQVMKRLQEVTGQARGEWPASLLRRMAELLLEREGTRRLSAELEARWLNLLGFALRPGYGLAADDWRVQEVRRVLQGKLAHSTPATKVEWWVMWRRLAGGLTAGQQSALADPLLMSIRQWHRQVTTGKGRGVDVGTNAHETAEIWRLLGVLELLPTRVKIDLGKIVLDFGSRKKYEAQWPALDWALARLGARVPAYGPLNAVVPSEVASDWLRELLKRPPDAASFVAKLAIMQVARRTDDRYRDLSESLRAQAVKWLTAASAPPSFVRLLQEGGRLDTEAQNQILGDAKPHGLRLRA